MKHVRPRNAVVGSIGAITIAATLGLAGLSAGASASPGAHHAARPPARPHAIVHSVRSATTTLDPVLAFSQQFQKNDSQFCDNPAAQPCDGNYNGGGATQDYGTIDRVPGGFSNGGFGNYAPSTKALFGTWMALVSGDQDGNQGTGCPGTIVEECTGPYALFGDGAENVYPTHGFTVTSDLYLSPATASNGALIDDDVEINDATGAYGIDNIITACPESGAFVINFGHNSPGSCQTPGAATITQAGWYRFVFVFSNVAGNALLTMNVVSEGTTPAIVASSGPQPVGGGSAEPITDWGGPGYFWLPTENISGVPLANFALQLGQHRLGNTP